MEQLKALCKAPTFPCQPVDSLDNAILWGSWVKEWGAVTANNNGVTGWAKVGDADPPRRIHICAWNPRKAMHPASKYGMFAPPTHYKWCPGHKLPAATVVDASAVADLVGPILSPTTAEPPATVEPPLDLTAQTELQEGIASAGSETKQSEHGCGTAEEPNFVTVVDAMSKVVDADAPIPVLAPPTAVAAPSQTERVASPRALPPAASFLPSLDHPVSEIDTNTPIGKLMWLARDIKISRGYVGYSGWVAFALMQRCRLFMWEGENRTNMLETFAPWSNGFCTAEVSAEVVFCKCMAGGGCKQVSLECKLNECDHFVVGIPVGLAAAELTIEGDSSDFEAFYLNRGIAIDFTIADGDCAIDAMCVLSGIERSFESRNSLRQKLHDFLICNAAHVGLQRAVDLTQEFQNNDTLPSASMNFAGVAMPATVVAGAISGTADDASMIPVSGNGSHREFLPLELEAVKWACCFSNIDVASLLCVAQSLPAAVVAEQVERYQARPLEPEPMAATSHRKAKTSRPYRSSLFKTRVKIGKACYEFLQKHGIDPRSKLPFGLVDLFIKDCNEIQDLATDQKSKNIFETL